MTDPSGQAVPGEPAHEDTSGHAAYIAFLDERDGRPVNPNTPEGELRNIAAFAAGVSATSRERQVVVKIMVWLVLLGFALAIAAGVVTGVHTL